MSEPLRFPWRVLAGCIALILSLFAIWEQIELFWFRGADPEVLHVWYLARGILGSVFTASLAAWILYRGHQRGLAQAQKHEEQMVEAARMAATGQLAAGLAHEIGNPLAGALECLRLMREGVVDGARAAEMVGTATDALERIDRSVRRFLDFSRPSELAVVTVDCALLMNQAARLVKPTLDRRGVVLFQAPLESATIHADPDALVQVVVNLLLNAGAACDPGGQVFLSAAVQGDRTFIQVADDGHGVDHALGDVTRPFVTSRPDGIGLGLAVSRRLVEAHGGHLEHRPRHPRGTVFEVQLPR